MFIGALSARTSLIFFGDSSFFIIIITSLGEWSSWRDFSSRNLSNGKIIVGKKFILILFDVDEFSLGSCRWNWYPLDDCWYWSINLGSNTFWVGSSITCCLSISELMKEKEEIKWPSTNYKFAINFILFIELYVKSLYAESGNLRWNLYIAKYLANKFVKLPHWQWTYRSVCKYYKIYD